jgi:hypothetical protein
MKFIKEIKMFKHLSGAVCILLIIYLSGAVSAADDPAKYLESGKILSQKLGRFGVGFQAGGCLLKSFLGDEDVYDINFGGAGFLDVAYGVKAHLHPYIGFFKQGAGSDNKVEALTDKIDSLNNAKDTLPDQAVDQKNFIDEEIERFQSEVDVREVGVNSIIIGMNLIMMTPRKRGSKIRLFAGGGGGAVIKMRKFDDGESSSDMAFLWDLAAGTSYQVSDFIDVFLELRQSYVLADRATTYDAGYSNFMLSAGFAF